MTSNADDASTVPKHPAGKPQRRTVRQKPVKPTEPTAPPAVGPEIPAAASAVGEVPVARELKEMAVADLKINPNQIRLFGEASTQKIDVLAEDIKSRGLQQPLVITRDGTLVDGHQRLRVVQKLGWEKVVVIIRHDLGDSDSAAARQEHILANSMRREFSTLQKARAIKDLVAMEKAATKGGSTSHGRLMNRVGSKVGLSGRQAGRHLPLLDTPSEVQDAVDAGRLSVNLAGRIAKLPHESKEKVARLIRETAGKISKLIKDEVSGPVRGRPPHLALKRLQTLVPQLELLATEQRNAGGSEHEKWVKPLLDEALDVISALSKIYKSSDE